MKPVEIFLSVVTAFFLYEAVSSGFYADYGKGCYYLLWTILSINIAVVYEGGDNECE